MHREPAHLWSTRVKRIVIMPMLSYALPTRATQFSDGNALVCHACPTLWPRCAASGLLKTRNQLT